MSKSAGCGTAAAGPAGRGPEHEPPRRADPAGCRNPTSGAFPAAPQAARARQSPRFRGQPAGISRH